MAGRWLLKTEPGEFGLEENVRRSAETGVSRNRIHRRLRGWPVCVRSKGRQPADIVRLFMCFCSGRKLVADS